MGLPAPSPGLVIAYAYLWRDEALRGREEGVKIRPCVILHTSVDQKGGVRVRVLPITHSAPSAADKAVEIRSATKQRLGLDDSPSWVRTKEVDRFTWPGPDLHPISRKQPHNFAYGLLPGGLFIRIRDRVLEHVRERSLREVGRDDQPPESDGRLQEKGSRRP